MSSPEVPETNSPLEGSTLPAGGSSDFPPYADPSYSMPEEITVKARLEDGSVTSFQVAIEKMPEGSTKPYYGGYRHTQTGLVYHHGAAQTAAVESKVKDISNLRNRDSQT
jgi:hypothetical protein